MPGPRRFNLLVVGGDGRRLLRLRVPAWALALVLGAGALVVASLGLIYGDYLALRQQRASLATLKPRLAEQQALLETYQARIREVGAEIDGWREIHARIWEPFGPELAPRAREAGIGGGRATPPEPARAAISELDALTEHVKEEGQSLRALDRLITRARRALVALPSRWPVRGSVNSEFGKRLSPWAKTPEFHAGIDIGANQGTPVRAPASARVVFAGAQNEYGLSVVLDHGQDIRSVYGHLSKVLVQSGQQVDRGAVIALSGNTGRSSGPHLHYEILVKGQAVNPRSYLWD
jgi:septal ring factor EnvC (AmiA/AmiB activator)